MPGRRARGPDPPSYHGVIVRSSFFLFIVILAGTGGEILSAHAMKQAARTQAVARPAVIALLEAACRPAMWVGLALQALAFFALLALLSWADLSFVVPVTALSYVVGAAGSVLFLRERVNRTRWAGVLLVCLGVAVMCASEL
jgi:multidrug transporter EmrE-like cation transporter